MPQSETHLIYLPGCVECPSCGNHTLPGIDEDSQKTATRCSRCGAVVTRDRKIEKFENPPVYHMVKLTVDDRVLIGFNMPLAQCGEEFHPDFFKSRDSGKITCKTCNSAEIARLEEAKEIKTNTSA